MRVAAIVVAAGGGSRFGARKQFEVLAGEPVAATAVRACRSVAERVVLVAPPDALGDALGADAVVPGGTTRSASVRAGLDALGDADVVVVHDAARPLASPGLFASVLAALDPERGVVGAVPAVPVVDTLKRLDRDGGVAATLDREGLVAVQTPQAFVTEVLRAAHLAGDDATDDAALVERAGGHVAVVAGEARNLKLTTREDLEAARRLLAPPRLRVGHGYDVHAFADTHRPLVLGGVTVRDLGGLVGHSDADVATHALCDAILGAAGLGDLGRQFPDDDPALEGVASTWLLERCAALAAAEGLSVLSADLTIVAMRPRLSAHLDEMSACLSSVLSAPVSVKATSPEGVGALGRAEGIAASAVALLAGT